MNLRNYYQNAGWLCLMMALARCAAPPPEPVPLSGGVRAIDERLGLSVFASDPEIVTPIGIAIDSRDRIYVLESNTHTPPKDYAGPSTDRIKVFEDSDGDGRPDATWVYAEGFEDGMNLAVSEDDELYLVTSRAVYRLTDHDGDGRSDGQERLLYLEEPEDVYDHAALLGLTISNDGWLYVSRGNTGGKEWRLVGVDGAAVDGYGDGGNVVRCRLNGTELQEVATGFWNPFGIAFDRTGRLLLVDNDPDSRGPNRLVDVVQGGDYGYESLYGNSGIHPYLAWNGELPGTLPYAVGLGEAPSGLLDAAHTSLPGDYGQSILVSIWEESKIVRVDLKPDQTSVKGSLEVIVEGDQAFRPVAFAADSRGVVYFTDWVIREYPVHGRGRIWRLENLDEEDRLTPRPAFSALLPDDGLQARNEALAIDRVEEFDALERALTSPDLFIQTVARTAFEKPVFAEKRLEAASDPNAEVRLQALLTMMKIDARATEERRLALGFLEDPDERIRRMALIWIGKQGMQELQPDLERSFKQGFISPSLFETYLATMRHLQPAFIAAYQSRSESISKQLPRRLPEGYIASIVSNERLQPALRAMAVSRLESFDANQAPLIGAATSQHRALQVEAIQALRYIDNLEVANVLLDLARDATAEPSVRADALIALGYQSTRFDGEIAQMDVDQPEVSDEAARYLRAFSAGQGEARPETVEGWQALASEEGNAARGRRVFYARQAQCSTCHRTGSWGGEFGPDLSNIGRSKTRVQIARSILKPSEEISPEWQGWFVTTRDGVTHYGRQIDVGSAGIELLLPDGRFENYVDVERYGVAPSSLMPEGLYLQLTAQDFRDLVVYLATSK